MRVIILGILCLHISINAMLNTQMSPEDIDRKANQVRSDLENSSNVYNQDTHSQSNNLSEESLTSSIDPLNENMRLKTGEKRVLDPLVDPFKIWIFSRNP